MKRLTTVLILIAVALLGVIGAAAQDSGESPFPSESRATVHRFGDASQVEDAWSSLTRYENGVIATLHTSDLEENAVYTVWWVVFNEPQNCSDGICNEDDIFVVEDGQILRDESGNRVLNFDGIGAANISVQHASGAYVNADGELHISANLSKGENPGIVFGPGLLDTARAEVHLVVRTHGELVAEIFDAQIASFGGGCEPIDAAPCDDVQFAIHKPISE